MFRQADRKPRLATEERAHVKSKKPGEVKKPVQEYEKGDRVWHDDCICLVLSVDNNLEDDWEYKIRDVTEDDEKKAIWVRQRQIGGRYKRAKK